MMTDYNATNYSVSDKIPFLLSQKKQKNSNLTNSLKFVTLFSIFLTLLFFFLTLTFFILFLAYHRKSIKNITPDCILSNSKERLEQLEDVSFRTELRKEIRTNIINSFQKDYCSDCILFIKGKTDETTILGSTTNEIQNKNFLYLTDILLPHFSIIVDIKNSKSILFAHELSEYEKIWYYKDVLSLEEIKHNYGIEEVFWNNENNVSYIINQIKPKRIFVEEYNAYSFLEEYEHLIGKGYNYTMNTTLTDYIHEKRLVKTDKEMLYMRYAIDVSAEVHVLLMKQYKMLDYEYQIAGNFLNQIMACGLSGLAYPSIAGTGQDASVLHYESDDQPINHQEDIILLDAGGAFRGYCADITRSVPSTLNGKFSGKHKVIYNMVLEIQTQSMALLKEGLNYVKELDPFAGRVLLKQMKYNGFINGDIEEMYNKSIHRIFMPHGLGHMVGLEVHDPVDAKCRPRILQKGMVVTVEPGIYFIEYSINNANKEQKTFLNMDKIKQYMNFGGVRIEDNCLITDDGYENLSLKVPKTIVEIERLTM